MPKSSSALALVLTLGLGCGDDAAPTPDAGRDASTRDSGSPDAGRPDAGGSDAGADAGPPPVVGPVDAIRAGRLIDPLDGSVIDDAVIVIADGRVTYVGTDAGMIPAAATVLDWSAYTVVPGFVDAHTHFSYMTDEAPGTYPWQHFFEIPPDELVAIAREAALATIRVGVTTCIDKGSFAGVAESLKAEIADGTTPGPRLFVAGGGLFQSPFGGFFGADMIREEVRRQIMEDGVDLIKIWADGCSDERLVCDFAFTEEELTAAVEAAHELGTPISIHAYHSDGAENVIRAAPDTLEHAEGLTAAQLTMLVDNDVTYVPTIDHNRYYRDNIRAFGYAPELYDDFTDYIEANLATATAAHAAGVTMAMGSDAVFTGFGENTGEINWLAMTGMTPLEVLQSATIVGAETIYQEDEIGRVAVGYHADLVAIEGDPLTDPLVLITGVRGVVGAGNAIDLGTEP